MSNEILSKMVKRDLQSNLGATEAVIQIVSEACSSGSMSGGTGGLDWIVRGENLIKLRNMIKNSASE